MKLCIVVGTRPEIIKMCPIIRSCIKRGINHYVLHTGQHYSYEMDKVFFDQLQLAEPKYNLKTGSNEFRMQVGVMMQRISKVLNENRPTHVLVEGDTNSVLAATLAANKLQLPVIHIEAGLRSHEIAMVEETNRIITDHLSEQLYAPTETSKKYLIEEGISAEKIHVVGNTVIDALFQNLKISKFELGSLNLKEKMYTLLTMHRPELVDIESHLKKIIEGLAKLNETIVFPAHPRTLKMIKKFDIKLPDNIRIIKPLGYLDFIALQKQAKLIITDSGGIQEEACALKVPCVTIRETTERPETVDVGANKLVGYDPEKLRSAVAEMTAKEIEWTCPYGDGTTAEKILDGLK